MTGLGFLVAVPDDAVVPLDAAFEFFVTVTAPDFANYTALSLRPQPIVDVTDPADTEVIHRYKANVPVLSNLTGASQGTGADKRLFLSQPYVNGANAGDGVEALVTSGANLRQLTGDPPAAPFQVLGPKSGHPVYVHQGDIAPITPPPGSTGAPPGGIELAIDTPRAVAAVIRLAPRRADDDGVQLRQRQRHAAHAHPGVRGPPAEPLDHLAVPQQGRRLGHRDRGRPAAAHPLRQRRHEAEAVDRRRSASSATPATPRRSPVSSRTSTS